MEYDGGYVVVEFHPIAWLFANSPNFSSTFCPGARSEIKGLVADSVVDGKSVILIVGIPVNVAVSEAAEEPPPIACAVVPVDDFDVDPAMLLDFFLPTVPPTAPPTTAPMITKAMITPMIILPVFDPQNDVPSGGFSLRRSYELNDFPTGTTFPCSKPEPCCENAGSAGGAAPGGVD